METTKGHVKIHKMYTGDSFVLFLQFTNYLMNQPQFQYDKTSMFIIYAMHCSIEIVGPRPQQRKGEEMGGGGEDLQLTLFI